MGKLVEGPSRDSDGLKKRRLGSAMNSVSTGNSIPRRYCSSTQAPNMRWFDSEERRSLLSGLRRSPIHLIGNS
jgi:hypothetical protein